MTPEQPAAGRPGTTPGELLRLFQRACGLIAQRDPDYATAFPLLTACVAGDPGNLIFVETMLRVRPHFTPRGHRLQGLFRRFTFQTAVDRGHWTQVAALGPRLLVLRPHDPRLLGDMARGCEALEYDDVAVRYLEAAVAADPLDADLQRLGGEIFAPRLLRTGRRLLAAGPLPRSARCPGPRNARLPRPCARRAGDRPPLPCPSSVRRGFGRQRRCVMARCQALVQAGDVRTAASLLTQALQAHPGELRLREQWEDVQLTEARQRLQLARRQALHTDHPQAHRLVSQLEDDLLRHELEYFSIRARRYPLETQWSLELAIRLKRSGNYAEAVRLLREVPADNPRSARVAFEIGECLQFQRRFREALESYSEAVRQIALLRPSRRRTGHGPPSTEPVRWLMIWACWNRPPTA